jgi:hypothetical protein
MLNEELVKTYNGPSTYQITVDGTVDEPFIKGINGMSVTHNQLKNKILSTLTGELRDQSALNGILNTLYDYQFTVISVMKLE